MPGWEDAHVHHGKVWPGQGEAGGGWGGFLVALRPRGSDRMARGPLLGWREPRAQNRREDWASWLSGNVAVFTPMVGRKPEW